MHDVPRPVPAGAPRAARLPDHRGGQRRHHHRAARQARPRGHPRLLLPTATTWSISSLLDVLPVRSTSSDDGSTAASPPQIGLDRQRPVYYLEVPPSLFGPIVEQLGAAASCATAGSPSRSRSAATWRRPANWTPGCTGCCARARTAVSITSSARSRSSSSSTCGSPTWRWPNCGTARACPPRRHRCRRLRHRGPRHVLRLRRRPARRGRTTCCRCSALVAHGPPPAPAPATRRTRRRRCSAPCHRPTLSTACAASTRGTPTSPAWPAARPPRPSWRCGWRSTTWRWADVPTTSCGPARRYHTRSPRCACSCAARPGWPSSPSRPGRA